MIVTKIKLVRLPKYLYLHIFIMLKNGSALYLIVCFLLFLTLVGHCLLHVTLISRAIDGRNVETKFHGRRISIDEVLKSINVNFFVF